MEKNNIDTEVKYWNFDLSVMSEFTDSEDTEQRLLPYLSILNDIENNKLGNARILSLLQEMDPTYKASNPDFYAEFLADKKEEIFSLIRSEIGKIDFSQISLFGITAKYNQWIPGMILAKEIKKIAPHVSIIVGGFGSKQAAKEVLELSASFDFSTWGEGEYPLLELNTQLMSEEPDFASVPRLFFRNKDITQSDSSASAYLDFDNYIYPDYSDFVNTHPNCEENELFSIPINSIRSCHWSKCKFCDFNSGYKLRSRTPECIVAEIEHIYQAYGYTTFTFVDSDTFGSLQHFENLLDLLIDIKFKKEIDFSFWAEIIPNSYFDAPVIRKMAIAGFKDLFIGYDGLSDYLLTKMSKSNTFSDNIFFVKECIKNGISPYVNVIKHLPAETEAEIQECMDNFHYLRFFYNQPIVTFSHNYVNLVMSSMSKYFKAMSDAERATYDYDLLSSMIPESLVGSENRFHLFRFEKSKPLHLNEWNKLEAIEENYKKSTYSYTLLENKGVHYYTEYCNNEEISNIVFAEPEYVYILKLTSTKTYSFDVLLEQLKEKFPTCNSVKLKGILSNLKQDYLIYCNTNLSNIVSLIEV